MQHEYKIPAERKFEVDASVAKLVKKANRFGVVPISWKWGEEFVEHKKWLDENGWSREADFAYRMLSFEGEPAKVGGYSFIARVEFEGGGCIVQTVPGEHVPPQYLNTDSHCDHCNSKRYRKDVFIVRSESGDHKQVGRQCLQDFLGNDPKQILSRFQFERQLGDMLDEEGRYFERQTFAYFALPLLTDAATCIRLFGWVSKGMANNREDLTPTISLVRCKDSWDYKDRKWWEEKVQPFQNEGDAKLADETIAWAKALKSDNEYLHNLSVIFNAEYISQPKYLGLAVSAVSAFLREKQRAEELNMKKDLNKKSEYQGEIKQRLRDIPVRMEAAIGLPPTEWGTSTLYKFRDEAGNVYSVITQANFEIGVLEAGFLTGTVKKHKEYNGTKETQLSRCVVAKVCVNKQKVLNGI